MRISVIGTGYVGLISGVCLAEMGHDVICVDVDSSKVDCINRGEPPIYEQGLEQLLRKLIGKNLSATTNLCQAILESELSLIAVGTPFRGEEIDLCYITAAAEEIGKALKEKHAYHCVVVKSTVVPGTTEDVVLPILERTSGKKAGADFGVGMNPEFLKEGEAVADFINPDRIVLGGIDERTLNTLAELYDGFSGVQVIRTNPKTAEMIKYTANSLLATLISFSNEVANLCARINVDVVEALQGVHLDKRLNPIAAGGERLRPAFLTYLAAGCGFGGSCFPKDVKALVAFGSRVASPMKLLQAVIDINEAQPGKMLELLKRHYPTLAGVKVTVLGVAFKPGTDDIRESPAIAVIKSLLAENAIVKAFDPIARHEAEKIFNGSVHFSGELADAVDGAEAVLLMTRWDHFHQVPGLICAMSSPPVLIDGRRMIDRRSVSKYEGIGL